MNDVSFGQSVAAAYSFLEDVLDDLAALIASLTLRLESKNWEIIERGRLNAYEPKRDYYYLLRPVDSLGGTNPNRGLLIQVRMAPTDFTDEPLLLAAVVEFDGSSLLKDVWKKWTKGGGFRVMKYLLDHPGSNMIPPDVLLPDFAAGGKCASGVIVALCSLSSVEDIERSVLQPLLQEPA